jgi:hypothetical protein
MKDLHAGVLSSFNRDLAVRLATIALSIPQFKLGIPAIYDEETIMVLAPDKTFVYLRADGPVGFLFWDPERDLSCEEGSVGLRVEYRLIWSRRHTHLDSFISKELLVR